MNEMKEYGDLHLVTERNGCFSASILQQVCEVNFGDHSRASNNNDLGLRQVYLQTKRVALIRYFIKVSINDINGINQINW